MIYYPRIRLKVHIRRWYSGCLIPRSWLLMGACREHSGYCSSLVVLCRSVGLGVVFVWNAESHLVVAQALWFGGSHPTVNMAEMGALEWGMGKLLSLGV